MLTCLSEQLGECCFSWVRGLVLGEAGRGIRTQGMGSLCHGPAVEEGSMVV